MLFGHHFPDEVTLSFKLLIDITVGKLVQSRGRVKHIGFAREASTLYLKFADRIAGISLLLATTQLVPSVSSEDFQFFTPMKSPPSITASP